MNHCIVIFLRFYFHFVFTRGGGPKTNSAEAFATLTKLKCEIESLAGQEECLDEQIRIMEMNKKIILEDEENLNQIYLTYDDLEKAHPEILSQSLIIAKMNEETAMEIHEPMYVRVSFNFNHY